MTDKLYEESDFQNIAAAIRRKNGRSNTYTVAQMGPAVDALTFSSTVLNGIIKQYKAANSTVSANTFVEFIVDFSKKDDEQLITGLPTTGGGNIAAVTALDSQRVFVVMRKNGLSGIICTVSNGSITLGTETVLISSNVSGSASPSIVTLSSNSVFIAYRGATNTALHAVVCTVSGTTITTGTDVQLDTSTSNSTELWATLLDTNKVFIVYDGGGHKLWSVVCTVSGTSITHGALTRLVPDTGATYEYAGQNICVAALSPTKVFVTHADVSSTSQQNGMVCTISGTTITPGTDTQILRYNQRIYSLALDQNRVLLNVGSGGLLIATVSGTSFTVDSVSTAPFTSQVVIIDMILVEKNLVFCTCSRSTSYLYGGLVKIANNNIEPIGFIQLSDVTYTASNSRAALVGSDYIFSVYRNGSSSTELKGSLVSFIKTVKEAGAQIDGVTDTQCTASTAGNVWVLNT